MFSSAHTTRRQLTSIINGHCVWSEASRGEEGSTPQQICTTMEPLLQQHLWHDALGAFQLDGHEGENLS